MGYNMVYNGKSSMVLLFRVRVFFLVAAVAACFATLVAVLHEVNDEIPRFQIWRTPGPAKQLEEEGAVKAAGCLHRSLGNLLW